MKKLYTSLTIVIIVAISFLRFGIPTKHSQKKQFEADVEISGNINIGQNLILTDGLISPGHSPGKITVTGTFTMNSTATYKCELKDLSGPGIGHDQIDVSGNLNLNGTLEVSLLGYTPSVTDTFDIIKFGGALTGTFSSTIGIPTGWLIDYGVTRPGKIILYGTNSPLPVELLNFNAIIKEGKEILISWQTDSEQNSKYFNVEHGIDPASFETLQRVKAQGISHEIHNYFLVDKKPAKGINYYRLKQVDLYGNFEYSAIVSVEFNTQDIFFYPNPANNVLSFSKPVASVIIYDMQGKAVIKSQNILSNLNISILQSGIYIVDINHGQYISPLNVK